MKNDGRSEKDRIRQHMQALRRDMSKEACVEAAHDMMRHLFADSDLLRLQPGDAVAIFSPIRGEPDFYHHRSVFFEKHLTVCLPRVEDGQMNFYAVGPDDKLVLGIFGLSEPGSDCQLVTREKLRVVLFPGLAFSRSGGRIGYGAGYYDRYFARETVPDREIRIGVAHSYQVFDSLPQDAYDIRVDYLVTPDGIWPTT